MITLATITIALWIGNYSDDSYIAMVAIVMVAIVTAFTVMTKES